MPSQNFECLIYAPPFTNFLNEGQLVVAKKTLTHTTRDYNILATAIHAKKKLMWHGE